MWWLDFVGAVLRESWHLFADAAEFPSANASRACDAAGPVLDWNSYWGEQNLHFVLRSRFTVPRRWRNVAPGARADASIFEEARAMANTYVPFAFMA